eukprot:s3195_g6.t1
MHLSNDEDNVGDSGASPGEITKSRSAGTVSGKRVSQWSGMELGEFARSELPPEWSIRRQTAAAAVLNPIFDICIGVIVMVNIVFIVLQTNLSGLGREPDQAIEWIIFAMLVIYTLEALLRLYVLRLDYFCSAWNLMDFGVLLADWTLQIITFMTVEEVPRATLLSASATKDVFVFAECCFWALRVLRSIRTLQLFRELYIMLYGFFSALKAIAWAAVLILLILLIWGIMAVEMVHPLNQIIVSDNPDLYGDCTRCPRAFETVHASVLTFAQQIVAGDSWGRVTIPIMEEYPWTAPYFIMVFVTIDLGLLNLILSVIVDKAHQAHQEDVKFQMAKRQKEFDNSKKKLTELCQILDEDMSGALSLEELLSGYDRLPEFQEQMRRMDVEREDMLSLFKCLDADQSGDILYAEFVEQVVKMRSQDVSLSLMFLRSQIKEIKQATSTMARELEELKRKWSPTPDLQLLNKPAPWLQLSVPFHHSPELWV